MRPEFHGEQRGVGFDAVEFQTHRPGGLWLRAGKSASDSPTTHKWPISSCDISLAAIKGDEGIAKCPEQIREAG